MPPLRRLVVLCAWSTLAAGRLNAQTFVPDFRLRCDDYTVLLAADAQLADGLRARPGGHGKFFASGWRDSSQQAEWKVHNEEVADYSVNVLLRRVAGPELRMEVSAAGKTLSTQLPAEVQGWQRIALPGVVPIPKGAVGVTLRVASQDRSARFDAHVMSVELVRPAVRDRLTKKALAARADAAWLQQARHGVMVHWTAETKPRQGEPKPYAQAVADFNVAAFADQIQRTGAGFVVFTTAHAYQYFPAPLRALDKILPGRTTERDLVNDLAVELNRRGIKLVLYYHLGSGADPDWLKASGFWETDTTPFFNNWQAIIAEVGERYREKIAGWWFDDGAVTYYHRSAPWEKLHRAARAGNPRRLIGFNPWELPMTTEFQDFYCGEFRDDPLAADFPRIGGNGQMPDGPHAGLQACATLITEGDWVHGQKDQQIGPPRWSAPSLAELLRKYGERKIVPIFNLEIHQDGSLSPDTLEMMERARAILRGAR